MDTSGKITAVNLQNGTQLWQINITPKGEDPTALTGGLAFANNKLYVTDGFGFLLALDPANGKKLWQVQLDVPARAGATIADGKLYVVTLANQLIALNADDGQVLWRHQGRPDDRRLAGCPKPGRHRHDSHRHLFIGRCRRVCGPKTAKNRGAIMSPV